MCKLALVQLCTWPALFTLWVYTTPVVALAMTRVSQGRREMPDGALAAA